MAKKALKAVSYLRVSGKAQIKGDGFTRQRKAISRYAQAQRITTEATARSSPSQESIQEW